jgi:hypothetical protein
VHVLPGVRPAGSMHQGVMLDCHYRAFDVPIVSLYFVVVSTS